jgi:hypothetical protein
MVGSSPQAFPDHGDDAGNAGYFSGEASAFACTFDGRLAISL